MVTATTALVNRSFRSVAPAANFVPVTVSVIAITLPDPDGPQPFLSSDVADGVTAECAWRAHRIACSGRPLGFG